MSGSSKSVPSTKGTSTLVRPRFAPGMLLQHDDLDQISDYTRDLTRLLFRSFFGCGVICGLIVKPDPKCGQDAIIIGAGIGLDCAGDPIYVPRDARVVLDENCERNPNDVLWVVLCATSRCCAPRPSMCPGDDDEDDSTSCTRERDGFEIRVVPQRPRCACSCVSDEPQQDPAVPVAVAVAAVPRSSARDCRCADPNDPCYKDHYLGICGCGCDDCARGSSCDCILLAKLTRKGDGDAATWAVDHSVRRFIRPVLMRDPQSTIDPQGRPAQGMAAEVKPAAAAAVAPAPAPAPAVGTPEFKPATTTRSLGGTRRRRTTKPIL
ncbi:MAG: hypothetical protein ABI603_00455 [Acidobacteriota bacterium]